jgi:hypothetical protein
MRPALLALRPSHVSHVSSTLTRSSSPFAPRGARPPRHASLLRHGFSSSSRSPSRQATRPIAHLLRWKPTEKVDNVVVHGYVRSVRSMKSHSFVSLGDGSSLAPLQAVIPADHAEQYAPPPTPLTPLCLARPSNACRVSIC